MKYVYKYEITKLHSFTGRNLHLIIYLRLVRHTLLIIPSSVILNPISMNWELGISYFKGFHIVHFRTPDSSLKLCAILLVIFFHASTRIHVHFFKAFC